MPHHSPLDLVDDMALLDLLTTPTLPLRKQGLPRRDQDLDPLMLAAVAASGPQVTRNHYHHDFFPAVMVPQAEGAWDWSKYKGEDELTRQDHKRLTYVSRQAPRRQRLGISAAVSEQEESKENDPLQATDNLPPHTSAKKRRSSVVSPPTDAETLSKPLVSNIDSAVEVKCMARTRIPTPHGPAFLHLYHNNRDNKEHLAIVVDSAQFEEPSSEAAAPAIRSQSLDAVWTENETEMDRITRGAYVGRLSPSSHQASRPPIKKSTTEFLGIPSPLIRIHSECFTGETIGSMRCDCGEQLDEAIRLISQPVQVSPTRQIPGRGAVVYLRQEGRGIGLLSKIRAYNLQDLGHDTVTANVMLGHGVDERKYDIAGAILRDLGLGDGEGGEGVRLLTNNPDKVMALQREGVRVDERVPMVPRSWQCKHTVPGTKSSDHTGLDGEEKVAGATLIGGGAVYGEDLDKYLRTKVLRMGHMLPLASALEGST